LVLVIIGPSDLEFSTSLATVKLPLTCVAIFSSSIFDKYRYFSSKNFQNRKRQVVNGSGSIHVKPLCPICHSRYFKSNFFSCVIAFSDLTNPFAAKRHGCLLQSNTFGSLMNNQGGCRGFITKNIGFYRFYRRLLSDFYRNYSQDHLDVIFINHIHCVHHNILFMQHWMIKLCTSTHSTWFLCFVFSGCMFSVFLDMKNIVCV
jgi:hypothetical protein